MTSLFFRRCVSIAAQTWLVSVCVFCMCVCVLCVLCVLGVFMSNLKPPPPRFFINACNGRVLWSLCCVGGPVCVLCVCVAVCEVRIQMLRGRGVNDTTSPPPPLLQAWNQVCWRGRHGGE